MHDIALSYEGLVISLQCACGTLVKNENVHVAMEWCLAHSEDPDFNDPVPMGSPEQQREQRKNRDIQELTNLGFQWEITVYT